MDLNTICTSRVEEVIELKSFEQKLASGKKLRIKLGFDSTAPDLHLGHAVVLQKLREFQDLGHMIVFIIGDYTARIGDPSGKSKARPPLSNTEIIKNAKTYCAQVGKILNVKKAEIRYNSEWFGKMKLAEFIRIVANFSSQRLLDREDFQKRIARGEEVFHHETLYSVMQAYDSVAIQADVELGGRDQKLNLLAGRELQKKRGLPPQDIMIMPLFVGIDGKEKMSKSLGNYVGLTDTPNDMFGKIMSIPDSLIMNYFEYGAFVTTAEQQKISERLRSENPRDVKIDLAYQIVERYHGMKKAAAARDYFLNTFSKKDLRNIPEQQFPHGDSNIVDVIVGLGFAASKSEARRLIEGGAVEVDKKIINDSHHTVHIQGGMTIRVGKKGFARIR